MDEIAGMARVMRDHALRVEVEGPLLDTCGTGGDGRGTFNVSTAAALVASGAGVRVAKHGNRAMTSGCGSADILEALGAKIDLAPEQVAECIRQTGFGFMFAQAFHPAMKYAAATRREIAQKWHDNPQMTTSEFNRMANSVETRKVGELYWDARYQGDWGTYLGTNPVPGLRYPDTQEDVAWNARVIREIASEVPMLLNSAVLGY